MKIPLADGRILSSGQPLVMGIINCTPDSFAVRSSTTADAVVLARQMIAEGADMLDIGGESSRPGSNPVAADIEIERVIPVIERTRTESSIPISIDTTKAIVAHKAIMAGVQIINDISALRHDPDMAVMAQQFGCPVVLMHMLGTPKTMQEAPSYIDVVREISAFFDERISYALAQGVAKEKIILDVGIGFGKRAEDILILLKNLAYYKKFGLPLLVGASRKRFIGELTGAAVADRLGGSLAAAVIAVQNGADIIRTHDVVATKQALTIAGALRED